MSSLVNPRVVCLGGGHGLAATLAAVRKLTTQITAIVTVADNGGSSGRLREEFPIFPPGDLRMALAALCADDEWGRSWADILQYRFTSDGPLNGHAVGNLLLAALWDRDEDPVVGLDRVAALLKVVGRVLPMAASPLDIEAIFENSGILQRVQGQVQVATAQGKLKSLHLVPDNPTALPVAVQAIEQAQWITVGPGSWFSSVLPHFLVAEQRVALAHSGAKKIIILNLDSHPNAPADEFAGNTPVEHLEMLRTYAPDMKIDHVLIDESEIEDGQRLQLLVESFGGSLHIADLRQLPGSLHHDVKKLVSALSHIMDKSRVG
ncbi:MAG: hypothetical protein RLZZ190_797 [Actinomycetota bacterium]